jgi:hypothetical protein
MAIRLPKGSFSRISIWQGRINENEIERALKEIHETWTKPKSIEMAERRKRLEELLEQLSKAKQSIFKGDTPQGPNRQQPK